MTPTTTNTGFSEIHDVYKIGTLAMFHVTECVECATNASIVDIFHVHDLYVVTTPTGALIKCVCVVRDV